MSYRSFCTGYDTFGCSSAEITYVYDSIEYLDRTYRTSLFTNSAKGAYCGRYNYLPPRTQGQGIFRTTQTIFFLTLYTDNRTIDTSLIKIQNFNPSQAVADLASMEKRTCHLTLFAAGAFAQIDIYQTALQDYSSISNR